MKRLRARSALTGLLCAGLFAGCATNLTGTGLPTVQATHQVKPVEANPDLFAKLPPRVQQKKTIVVGTSPTYKPVEFLDNGEIVGLDVDLFNAVAARMGVKVEWKQSEFDQILIGVDAKKYDAGVAAFTVNTERTKVVDMVSYLSAGSLWTVRKGNPDGVKPGEPCGLSIAVQTGVVQESELKAAQAKCGANKIKILSYADQGEATGALVNGRAQVMAADSPIAAYAVKMSNDKLEELGTSYDTAPYGTVTRKDDEGFAEAIAQAFTEIKASGNYDEILARWNMADGAVAAFEVNPA